MRKAGSSENVSVCLPLFQYEITFSMYSARTSLGTEDPVWNDRIEEKLRTEWEASPDAGKPWRDVMGMVRHGYEYKPKG